jgi:hypothetical protein
LKGIIFNIIITIQEHLQDACFQFEIEFLQMLPAVAQSRGLMHQIAEKLFSKGQHGIECKFILSWRRKCNTKII